MKRIACAVLATGLAAAGQVSASDIGSVAAVNRDVRGARPAEQPRRLILNERLIQNERVTTSGASGAQVLFLDQTTLTLTPNSDIILDKYVFDPDADRGELAVTMLRGAMRMVGGRITKTSSATIKTPSATIGIRGGIGNITVRDDGSTEYMHIAGFSATISSPTGDKVTITREGGMAAVSPPAGGTAGFAAQALNSAGLSAAGASGRQQAGLAAAQPGGGEPSSDQANGSGQEGASSAAGGQQSGSTAAASDSAAAPTGDSGTDGQQAGGGEQAGLATGAGEGAAAEGNEVAATGGTESAATGGGDGSAGGGNEGAPSGGTVTYLGVATPEMVRATMSVRAGQGDGGSSAGLQSAAIQNGIVELKQDISGRPDAITDAPISTTGEQQDRAFASPPPRLDDRPIEEFTENEVAMATEAEAAAQAVAQELNAISFNGAWSATAGLNSGGFGAIEDNLAFRMRYSLLDQQGFVTVQLPGGQDGAALTTFDGASILGDRFLIVGDEARNLVADADRLTLLGGEADGTALTIDAGDIANGSIFVDYEGVGLSEIQFVDGRIVGLEGQRLTTAEARALIENLQQTLPVATD